MYAHVHFPLKYLCSKYEEPELRAKKALCLRAKFDRNRIVTIVIASKASTILHDVSQPFAYVDSFKPIAKKIS